MESQPLQRQLSIESEPKTLFHRDLCLAREAALEVIRKHTKEEASRIFLELIIKGLRPVENVKFKLELSEDIEEEKDKEKKKKHTQKKKKGLFGAAFPNCFSGKLHFLSFP